MKRSSIRSISVRTSDVVSGNVDLCLIISHLKHTAIRTREMAMPRSLTVLKKAFGSNNRPTPDGQRFPENSTSETLSP